MALPTSETDEKLLLRETMYIKVIATKRNFIVRISCTNTPLLAVAQVSKAAAS
jgi:hypothetical protein